YRLADRRVADLIRDADQLLASTANGVDACQSYTD
ncbi:MAG: transcriptional regulator, partial [Alphaproteobacteria bacterium HGW-Alphaproteobacteria-8]